MRNIDTCGGSGVKSVRKNESPKVVARYNEYAITQGVRNGMYCVFERDTFVGHSAVYANAVGLISLREGQKFDIAKVEDLRDDE